MKYKVLVTITIIFLFFYSYIASANIESNPPTFSNDSETFSTPEYFYSTWEKYPYSPSGTEISFPIDEGIHKPYTEYTKEWWYANFHLKGVLSGNKYGAFGTYCRPFPFRFFSIFDYGQQQMFTNVKVGALKASETELDLEFSTLFDDEYWYTKKTESGDLIPFQYTFMMKGKAREQDKEMMKLDVDMHCLKPPMIVGGDGLVDIGQGWSYYYCQTKIEVTGTITVHGFTEGVEGYAWIDHQWGDFNVGLPKNRVLWEWFSIKLDDNREIMVADTWRMDNKEKYESTYDGLNYLDENNRYELLEGYSIKQLGFWEDPINKKLYANKWSITEPSKNINLIVVPDYPDQLIRIFDLIDPYMPISLWEGSCTVSGTIEGKAVTGKAYTELTHSWE